MKDKSQHQRGSLIVGIIIGVVLGLFIALAVAVYVTKVPVPFFRQSHSVDQDAENQKNRNWDPNAPLYGKNPAKTLAQDAENTARSRLAASRAAAANPVVKAAHSDLLGELALARLAASNNDPFFYFLQVGAYRTAEDAQAQRAKLSLMGVETKVSEREQSGRQVFRVRLGPFNKKEEADRQKEKLTANGVESALVRVQR